MTDSENHRQFREALQKRVRGGVAVDEMTCGIYATDASLYQIMPLAVATPMDAEDVKAAVAAAVGHGVPVISRGGGTSLGGQAIGEGLILDFTKHMNKILELNVEQRWARVQPGVVRDNLNAELAKAGLHFAPDPATTSRAAVGGMIANNSSGTKSLVYGKTVDHTLAVTVLLPDGEVVEFGELSPEEYETESGRDDRKGGILREFKRIVEANRREIEKRYPKIMRRVMGYNLDEFTVTDRWNLAKLIAGSEGTLGIILEAKINLEPVPRCAGLCLVHFEDLLESIEAVEPILTHEPSAVEIMDTIVIHRARRNLTVAPLCDFMEGDPKAILVVEFYGETHEEMAGKQKALIADLKGKGHGCAYPIRNDPAGMARVWAVRKAGLGLMLGIKGDSKPVAFIEDAAIPIKFLPRYIDTMLDTCQANETEVAMYAHAGVGLIHVRPILNMKTQTGIDRLKAIADKSFELVKEFGGSFSGEHGDGRIRSPYIEAFYGKQIAEAFGEVKTLFDPQGILNPKIIVDPEPWDMHLRYGVSYKTPSPPTEYHYRADGNMAWAVEMCNGVGACRQTLDGTMCPSYRATGDEEHSTRGRANALRLAMTGQFDTEGMTSDGIYRVFELCLSCKACKSECPSNVDMARLKSEFLQQYHDARGIKLREKMVADSTTMARRLSGWPAPIVNAVQRRWLFRKIMEKVAGLDSRRILPEYTSKPFPAWFRKERSQNGNRGGGSKRKVALFDDTYMNYFEPRVGISAVELLESCGFEVVLAKAGCCQRPRISHGFLRDAKREGEKTLRNLDRLIGQGLKIVVCEPGCASALVDDLPDLIDDEELGNRVRDNVVMIDEFLAIELREGRLDCTFRATAKNILIHGHCHQKSLFSQTAMKEILDRAEGVETTLIDSGCCGMAGSFGYEKEHYDLSMEIGEDRLFPAIRERAPGAEVVACGFSCRHQIEHATGVKPVHWVETLRGESAG